MAETLFRQWFIEEAEEDWDQLQIGYFAEHLKIQVNPSNFPDQLFAHYSLPGFDAGMKPVKEPGSNILSNKYRVETLTVLVSKLNPRFPRIWAIGKEPGEHAICSTEFQVLKPKHLSHYGFLYQMLKSKTTRDELIMAASGTSGSHQRVRPEDILNIKFAVPSIDIIEQYSERVMPLIKKSWTNHAQIQSLESLRDTLLPKLMSGEIRII